MTRLPSSSWSAQKRTRAARLRNGPIRPPRRQRSHVRGRGTAERSGWRRAACSARPPSPAPSSS
ncbi:hypothetical protein C5C86_08735 [Rathayibacter sp. AY1E4]|nr:hypothetical protein C5C57_10330 [Rathayibacter sp. AY1C5]PPH41057.1 hypothetical protein C5C86_08735 [Rathayibacter sp. AY1E4]